MEEPAEVTPEVQAKYDLVVRNLQEVLGGDKLKKQIASGKNVHLYWGTATTGRPHIGYLVPMQKIADFLHAGLRVTILFADLHAFLDNMKSTWELLENRVIYYEHVIKALLQSVNVPIEKLHFVRGTTYQLSREYTFDILKLCTQVTQRDALRAGAEVVKQVDSPLLSGLLYPLLQAVDEQYLKVDGQFGGVDQRKIFILAEEQLPKIKLGKRWHLMNPMVPGLTGSKMSSSEADSKIDLLDDAQLVERKIAGAVCELDAGDNGVLAFYEHVLFPIILPKPVIVGNKEFLSISGIKTAFAEGAVTAEQLKTTLHTFINDLLSRVQKECATPEIKEAITKGYQAVQAREVASVSNVQLDLSPGQRSLLEKVKCGFEVSGCEIALQRALAEDRAVNIVIPLFCKGRFHIGFLVPLLHVKKLVARGVPVRVTVLLSDMVGFLDNEKVAWTVRDARCAYFAAMCRSAIRHLELDNYVTVARAADSDHQFSKDYVLDMYKMASIVSRDETSLAEGSFLSGNLLSLIYALDVHYCSNADVVLLGDDEQKTALIAERLWTRSLAVSGPTQLHYPYLIGMDEAKMSAGNPEFMLDPHDTPKQIKTKIGRSFCEPQNVQRNVALELARQLVFPLIDGKPLEIKRSPDNGGDISLNSFDALVKEFEVGTTIPLHPADLKAAIIGAINGFCDLLRADVPASVVASAFPVSKGGKGNKKK